MFAIPLFTPTLSFHVKIIVSAPPINREEEGRKASRAHQNNSDHAAHSIITTMASEYTVALTLELEWVHSFQTESGGSGQYFVQYPWPEVGWIGRCNLAPLWTCSRSNRLDRPDSIGACLVSPGLETDFLDPSLNAEFAELFYFLLWSLWWLVLLIELSLCEMRVTNEPCFVNIRE